MAVNVYIPCRRNFGVVQLLSGTRSKYKRVHVSCVLRGAKMPLEWTNEQIIAFLELLETERVIWDTNDRNHKFKHKVNAAWKRISEIMNCPVVELKTKKKSLMATFRPLIKKKMNSIKSGTCADDVFQPIWFAFDIMERFLGPIYVVEDTMNTEYQLPQSDSTLPTPSTTHFQEVDGMSPTPLQPVIKMEIPETNPETIPERIPKTIPQTVPEKIPSTSTRTNAKKKPRTLDDILSDAEKKINESFATLCHVLENKKSCEDECDVYAKLLAKKLRKYPESMRYRIMHSIDGLLLDNPYPEERPSSGDSSQSS